MSGPPSPDDRRHRRRRRAREADQSGTDTETNNDDGRRHRHRHHHRDRNVERDRAHDQDQGDRSHRSRRNDDERRPSSPTDSDETVELPERFDKYGRKKSERGDDPIAEKIEEFLQGSSGVGKLFKSVTDKYLGGDLLEGQEGQGGSGTGGSNYKRRRDRS